MLVIIPITGEENGVETHLLHLFYMQNKRHLGHKRPKGKIMFNPSHLQIFFHQPVFITVTPLHFWYENDILDGLSNG